MLEDTALRSQYEHGRMAPQPEPAQLVAAIPGNCSYVDSGQTAARVTSGQAFAAADREACFRLRHVVYIDEMQKSLKVESESGIIRDPADDVSIIFYAKRRGEVVGTVRSTRGFAIKKTQYHPFFKHDSLKIGAKHHSVSSRLIIAKKHRHTQVYRALLENIYVDGRAAGTLLDFIHCSPELMTMYEMLGYRQYKRGLVSTEVGIQIPMMLVTDDIEHLAALGSPFAQYASRFNRQLPIGWFDDCFPQWSSPSTRRASSFERFIKTVRMNSETGALFFIDKAGKDFLAVLTRGSALVRAAADDVCMTAGEIYAYAYLVLSGCLQPSQFADGALQIRPGQILAPAERNDNRSRSLWISNGESTLLAIPLSSIEKLNRIGHGQARLSISEA